MLEVAVLGTVEATSDGRPLPLGGPLQRALLARLALAGRQWVAPEMLVADLWERVPRNPRHTLQVNISRLRASLAVDIERGAGGYRLAPDRVDVDADRFARRYERARALLNSRADAEAAAVLRDALALWRGPALADLTGFAGLRSLAVALDESRHGALADRIDADLACGMARDLVPELQALVAEQPLSERHWAQLMTALCHEGRQNEALDAFRRARDRFAEHLGSEPGAALRGLHQAILRGDPPVPAAPAAPVAGGVSSRPAAAPRETADLAARLTVPLAGRSAELATLARAWAEAQRGLRIVTITGEAGIGKTRLAAEFAAGLQSGATPVRFGRCGEGLEIPYQPFVEILRADVAELRGARLRDRLGRDGAELATLLPELAADLGTAVARHSPLPDLEKYRTWEAVSGWLESAGAVAPILLLIDDLHWADPDTVLLLDHLVRTPRPIRALILITHRDRHDPGDDGRFVTLLRQSETVTHLSLQGLDHAEILQLLAAELRSAGVEPPEPGELTRWVAKASGGNPLFVLELARRIAALIPEPGDDHAALLSAPLPTGLSGVIRNRVNRLPEPMREQLQCAAVIGREFDPLVLARVIDCDVDALDDLLTTTVRARLVERLDGPRLRYTFCHDVVRIALYEALPPMRRLRMHRKVADAILALHGTDSSERVNELAHHYAKAAATGPTELAVHYLKLAGDTALAQRAPAVALDFYRRAGHLLPVDAPDEQRCDLLLATGVAEFRCGGAGYRETLLAAARLALGAGDTARLTAAAIANNRGWYSSTVGVDAERVAMIDAALDRGESGDAASRCQLLAAWALESVRDPARREQAVARSTQALLLAEQLGDDLLLAEILSHHYAVTYAAFSDPHGSLEIAERLYRVAHAHADVGLQLNAAIGVAQAAMLAGRFDLADRALQQSRELGERLDQPARLWMTRGWQATRLATRGLLAEAEREATETFEYGMQIAQPDAFTWFGGQLFTFRLMAGRLAEFLDEVEEQVGQYAQQIPAWRAAYAFALTECGRGEHARTLLSEFVAADFATLPLDMLWLQGMAYLAMTAAALDDAPAARAIYARLLPYAGLVADNATIDAGPVNLHLGTTARVGGRPAAARAHLSDAIELCRRADAPVWLARAEHELALLDTAA